MAVPKKSQSLINKKVRLVADKNSVPRASLLKKPEDDNDNGVSDVSMMADRALTNALIRSITIGPNFKAIKQSELQTFNGQRGKKLKVGKCP